jgi:uncharacterized membrane protein HdeD (DUF308 family)
MDEGLGGKFWFGVIGVILACAVGAVLIFVLVSGALFRWGLIGVFVVFGGLLLLWSWYYDRKKKKEWGEDE